MPLSGSGWLAVVTMIEKKMLKSIFKKNVEEEALLIQI